MKKIVFGKEYDTEKATEIGAFWSGGWNFEDVDESLYLSPEGAFFFHGWGGALTAYGHDYPDGRSEGGERIIPASREEALSWCKRHLEEADYVQYFKK